MSLLRRASVVFKDLRYINRDVRSKKEAQEGERRCEKRSRANMAVDNNIWGR